MTALFSFLVSVAYVPGLSGAAITPRWAVMAVGAAAFLAFPGAAVPPAIRWADVWGLAFLAWCAVTALWAPVPLDAADALMKLAIMSMVYVWARGLDDLRPVYIGFGLGICVNSVVMIVERLTVGDHAEHFGLFWNPNFAGEAAALVIVALAAERIWWLASCAWPSLILSGCRGAIAGMGLAVVAYIWGKSRWVALIVVFAAPVLLLAFLMRDLKPGIWERFDIWQDTALNLTWLGHGIGQFWPNFPHI